MYLLLAGLGTAVDYALGVCSGGRGTSHPVSTKCPALLQAAT